MKVEIKEAPGFNSGGDGWGRGARETLEFDGAKENALQTRRSNRGFCLVPLFSSSQYARSFPLATGMDSNVHLSPFYSKIRIQLIKI